MLCRLIDPMKEEEFYSVYWGKKPFVIHREEVDFYADLLSFKDMSELILCKTPGMMSNPKVVNYDDDNLSDYEKAYAAVVKKDETQIDKICMYGLGRSLVLRSADLYSGGALDEFCRQLEKDIKCQKVFANVYMTPPFAQGLRSHADFSDVFVLQIEGEKSWKIYHSEEDSLTLGDHEHFFDDLGDPEMDFVLESGDVLYIPRAFVHSASTRDSSSLHLTLGIIRFSWKDLLNKSKALLSRPGGVLSSPVPLFPFMFDSPTGINDLDSEETEVLYQKAVGSLFELPILNQSLEEHLSSLKASRGLSLKGQKNIIDGLSSLSLDTLVCLREGFQYKLSSSGEVNVLWFHSKHMLLSDGELEAFRYLESGESCKAGGIPDGLSEVEKLDFVKHLCRECVLRYV